MDRMVKLQKGVFLKHYQLYDIDFSSMPIVKKAHKGRATEHIYNIPVTYDIETSSFYNDKGEKVVITYSHAISIDGYCFQFREWDEFVNFLNEFAKVAKLHYKKRSKKNMTAEDFEELENNREVSGYKIVIFAHNLPYEFNFLKCHFQWSKVFANGDSKKVIKATLKNYNIEFRCSYILSGLSLAGVAKNLQKSNVKKMSGDLDFSLLRTPITPLTDKEQGYIINDVIVLEHYIREVIEADGSILDIPLTNTGYVRNYCRSLTIGENEYAIDRSQFEYRKLMSKLTLTPAEYEAHRKGFGGGFTHANIKYVGILLHNVNAKDFASSYPARTIMYKFPMGKGIRIEPKSQEEVVKYCKTHCCMMHVRLRDITRSANEGYLSIAKATEIHGFSDNNGRVEVAEKYSAWMTETDFRCVTMSYDIEPHKWDVTEMYIYEKGYLPTPLIKAIIKLYKDKTTLKDVEGMAVEYLKSKGMLNSTYGMAVMDFIQQSFKWNDKIKENEKDKSKSLEELVEQNNNDKKRFLFYPWGVWITSYARYDLFRMVLTLGEDYVYCDTDAVYYLNGEKNEHLFVESNKRIEQALQDACDHHGIDFEEIAPKNPKGKRCVIGVWEDDGFYTHFKSLGAKRYITSKLTNKIIKFKHNGVKLKINKKIHRDTSITVSGVNKKVAMPYLLDTYGKFGVFEAFKKGLVIPEGFCGKSIHKYIDDEHSGVCVDYQGREYEYNEKSGIHLEETLYSLNITDELGKLIDHLRGQ